MRDDNDRITIRYSDGMLRIIDRAHPGAYTSPPETYFRRDAPPADAKSHRTVQDDNGLPWTVAYSQHAFKGGNQWLGVCWPGWTDIDTRVTDVTAWSGKRNLIEVEDALCCLLRITDEWRTEIEDMGDHTTAEQYDKEVARFRAKLNELLRAPR